MFTCLFTKQLKARRFFAGERSLVWDAETGQDRLPLVPLRSGKKEFITGTGDETSEAQMRAADYTGKALRTAGEIVRASTNADAETEARDAMETARQEVLARRENKDRAVGGPVIASETAYGVTVRAPSGDLQAAAGGAAFGNWGVEVEDRSTGEISTHAVVEQGNVMLPPHLNQELAKRTEVVGRALGDKLARMTGDSSLSGMNVFDLFSGVRLTPQQLLGGTEFKLDTNGSRLTLTAFKPNGERIVTYNYTPNDKTPEALAGYIKHGFQREKMVATAVNWEDSFKQFESRETREPKLSPTARAALTILRSKAPDEVEEVPEGELLEAIIEAQPDGQKLWAKFQRDFVGAKGKGELGRITERADGKKGWRPNGPKIHDWQEQWARDNINRAFSLYDEAAAIKYARGAPSIFVVGNSPKDIASYLEGLKHEVAAQTGQPSEVLTGSEIALQYGITGKPDGWGNPGDSIVFDSKDGSIKFLTGGKGQVAKYTNRSPDVQG